MENKIEDSSSGPQFGMENQGGWGKRFREWLNRYGSSVILPVVALLILAGGIYLYANQKSEPAIIQEEVNQEEVVDLEEEFTSKEIEVIIPESRKESGSVIEKAVRGDSVTRLSRRALKSYTENNSENLTNEHKIYIEDYLKDQVGSRPLEVGEEITFSEDLIKEAIDASLELSPEQLKNLEKYSALVVSW
ncbi:hypothetical protein KKB98_00730 [Patescibacteria group bacterium]|nr:hypothetical protein [Patescibacteria group bacterium]MCG2809068.1 hypothetical protein [Candidatus Portnoybacteria bacterium]